MGEQNKIGGVRQSKMMKALGWPTRKWFAYLLLVCCFIIIASIHDHQDIGSFCYYHIVVNGWQPPPTIARLSMRRRLFPALQQRQSDFIQFPPDTNQTTIDHYFQGLALEEARQAFDEDEVPIGALVVVATAEQQQHQQQQQVETTTRNRRKDWWGAAALFRLFRRGRVPTAVVVQPMMTKNDSAGNNNNRRTTSTTTSSSDDDCGGQRIISTMSYRILSRQHNRVEQHQDASAHAELLALRQAAQRIGNWRLNRSSVDHNNNNNNNNNSSSSSNNNSNNHKKCNPAVVGTTTTTTTLYSTLEPCVMCCAGAQAFRVDRIVYGAVDYRLGAIESHLRLLDDVIHPYHHITNVVGGIYANESQTLLQSFFRSKRRQKKDDSKKADERQQRDGQWWWYYYTTAISSSPRRFWSSLRSRRPT
jgi:tRNA(adenine34) deaminase